MRPKKRVLLIDSEEANISTLRLVLSTHGFSPLYAAGIKAALTALPADLVLVYCLEAKDGEKIVSALKKPARYTPMMLVTDRGKMAGFLHSADGVIDSHIPIADLLERLVFMSRRKRGPRKGHIRQPKPEPELATA